MENLLQECKNVSVYIDNIPLRGPIKKEHLENLDWVLAIVESASIKGRVDYLGYVINKKGLHPKKEKIQAITVSLRRS